MIPQFPDKKKKILRFSYLYRKLIVHTANTSAMLVVDIKFIFSKTVQIYYNLCHDFYKI